MTAFEALMRDAQLDENYDLIDQFVISKRSNDAPKLWDKKTLNGFVFAHHPRCRLVPVFDGAPQLVGYILGLAVDGDANLIAPDLRLSAKITDPAFFAQLEAVVEMASGRFVVLILAGKSPRLYFDAIADYTCVYNPEEEMVASTPHLATRRDQFDPLPFVTPAEMHAAQKTYMFGMTQDAGIHMILANHYLDLTQMKLVRHWPHDGIDIEPHADKYDDALDFMNHRLGQIVSCLVDSQPYLFPLSGGRDSRTMLGASLRSDHPVRHCYSHWFHHMSRKDSLQSKELADHFGLTHRLYVLPRGAKPDEERFFALNGRLLYGTGLRSYPIEDLLPQNHVILRGNVMGILRAVHWHAHDHGQFDLDHGIRRLRAIGSSATDPAPYRDWLAGRYRTWFADMPEAAQNLCYDFAWLETILPHSQGVRHYSTHRNFIINPFADRQLIAAAMRIPIKMRSGNSVYHEMMRRTEPKLLDFNFV